MALCSPTCEEPTQYSDVVGICNVVTGLCECPEGFDGIDEWQDLNDCHIDQDFRYNMRVALLVSSLILTIASSISLLLLCFADSSFFRLVFKWIIKRGTRPQKLIAEHDLLFNESLHMDDGDALTVVSGMDMPEDEKEEMKDLERKKETQFVRQSEVTEEEETRRRASTYKDWSKEDQAARKSELVMNMRLSILSMVFLVFGVFAAATYYRLQFSTKGVISRGSGDFQLNAFYGIAMQLIFVGIWLLTDTYYMGLPNIRLYGKLFKMNGALIRNPKAFHYICDAYMLLGIILCCVFGILLPVVSTSHSRRWDDILLVCFFFLLASNFIATFTVVFALTRIYSKVLKALKYQQDGIKDKLVEMATRAANTGETQEEEADVTTTVSLFKVHTLVRSPAKKIDELEKRLKGLEVRITDIKGGLLIGRLVFYVYPVVVGAISAYLLSILLVDVLKNNMYIYFSVIAGICIGAAVVIVLAIMVFILRHSSGKKKRKMTELS